MPILLHFNRLAHQPLIQALKHSLGEEKKPELYPDAPQVYGELMNYPGQYPSDPSINNRRVKVGTTIRIGKC